MAADEYIGKQMVSTQDPGMGIWQTDAIQIQKGKRPEMVNKLLLSKQWTKESKSNKGKSKPSIKMANGLRDG